MEEFPKNDPPSSLIVNPESIPEASSLIVNPGSIPEEGSGDLLKKRYKDNEIGEDIPVCYDLEEYFKVLRESEFYKSLLEERKRKLREKIGEEEKLPSDEEIEAAFWQTEEFKQFFWCFNEWVIRLGYDENYFPEEFRQALSNYIRAVGECFEAARRSDPELLEQKDRERSRLHDKAAKALLNSGKFPQELLELMEVGLENNLREATKEYLARIIIRAFLVDIGKDFIESARQSDVLRKFRGIKDEQGRNKILEEYKATRSKLEGLFINNPGKINSIREEFCRMHNGLVKWKKKKNFMMSE